MTIALGLATPDGLVLAADSRTTHFLDESTRTRIASDSADKVFSLCGRYAVATFGDAFIGDRTIAGLMTEFIVHISDDVPNDVRLLSSALGEFFNGRYAQWRDDVAAPVDSEEPVALGFIVGGYDELGIGRLHEVLIPGPEVLEHELSTAEIGVLPRGQRDVIDRLVLGIDRDVLSALPIELSNEVDGALDQLAYRLLFPITVQDGIDFASFLIRTTVDMQRFSDGTQAFQGGFPGCGGPTRIAVVRRGGVDWITPPTLRADGPAGLAEGAL